MKKILALFSMLTLAMALTAATPHTVAFDSPVDASHYAANAGSVASILPLDYDFTLAQLRFQLLDANGNAVAGGAVFGVTCADSSDATIKAAVLAAIQAAH